MTSSLKLGELSAAASGLLASGIESELELGMLLGLTDATPDVTVKANMHFKF